MGHRPMYCTNANKDDCTKFDDRVRTGMPFVKTFGLEELFYKNSVDGKINRLRFFFYFSFSWIMGSWTFIWKIMANLWLQSF